MTIVRHDNPHKRIHVRCNNFRLCLWSDGLAIDQFVQEKQKHEIPRDNSGVNIQGGQVKPSHGLLTLGQGAMDVCQPDESPKEMSS